MNEPLIRLDGDDSGTGRRRFAAPDLPDPTEQTIESRPRRRLTWSALWKAARAG